MKCSRQNVKMLPQKCERKFFLNHSHLWKFDTVIPVNNLCAVSNPSRRFLMILFNVISLRRFVMGLKGNSIVSCRLSESLQWQPRRRVRLLVQHNTQILIRGTRHSTVMLTIPMESARQLQCLAWDLFHLLRKHKSTRFWFWHEEYCRYHSGL